MNLLEAGILTAVISLVGGVISAVLSRIGKGEEVAAKQAADLMEAQGARISALETRQDSLERKLDEVRADLRDETARSTLLHRALDSALRLLRGLRDWIDAGAVLPAPPGNLDDLEVALAESARPRRPPDD